KAEGLFDENMPVGFQRHLNERSVQVMPCRDQERGRRWIIEQFARISRRRLKAEFRFGMLGTQGRLVHDGAEGDLALEVRQEHRAREVAGANDVQSSDRSQKFRRSGFWFPVPTPNYD